ncbi:MAG TPA: hypothetical protein VG890_01890 [Puia sp.]|nr:hypothetical protein [Puia sp.]
MKKIYSRFFAAALFLLPICGFAQLTNGGINAFFGIDGDTRNNYVKYGPLTGFIASDDWFSSSPSGKNVIDTSNAAYYSNLLQTGANIGFNKRMSVPLYSKLNGKLWLDAVYGRDYIATSPLFDSTAFTIAAKNGDDPGNWVGGTTNFPDKDDLTDVYAHMRRDGTDVHDSLWLFTGVATVGTSGSKYFDIELYKKNFSYNATTGAFTSAGTDAGHTQWIFNASGDIIQTGDMIIAVNFTPGTAPVVDVRIWVSQATFAGIVPSHFNFGPNFDGATPAFGYASILSKTGTTAFGSGISNYSANAAQDTTYATPWGTEQATKIWGTQYQSLQLIEVGLNLTRIGVDPALYSALGLSPCESLFSDIFFKSRASNSFVSQMHDFVTPLEFLREPVMDFSLQSDTLRCNKSVGTIQITNNTTIGYYNWQTTNGNISGSNADSSQINMDKPGTYIVSASPAEGCPATRTETVVIPIDTFPPVASIMATVGSNYSYLQLYGGDLAASNYPTPFGGSQGLLWDWSGPKGFTSTIQNPNIDTAWGDYQLIVTEKRNGCKDTAVKPLSYWDFSVLAGEYMNLNGLYHNGAIWLSWSDNGLNDVDYYVVERSTNNADFSLLSTVFSAGTKVAGSNTVYFTDQQPASGNNYYRIKAVSKNGQIVYSNIAEVNADIKDRRKFYLVNNYSSHSLSMVSQADKNCEGTLVVYNVAGATLSVKKVQLSTGTNTVEVPTNQLMRNSVIIVSLFLDNQPAFSQKAIIN